MADFLEDKKKTERAFLVGIDAPGMTEREPAELIAELRELLVNLDIEIAGEILVKLRSPNPAFLVGRGKVAEIVAHANSAEADLIVFDDDLSPAQQRNWESESKASVIDRREVILEIFARRARTREAMLQVDLARMEYSLPRLRRAWMHLSRQRGGGTTARGQGETQLEADRRLIRDRIASLRRELSAVIRQRGIQRRKRMRIPVPCASVVGYTNAGKSTLLNRLTGANVPAENKLFATLDPTTRQLELPHNRKILFTDTVGFIRRLPHNLVDAFKATLEEVVVADFLVHVLDASSPSVEEHARTTLDVLRELGAAEKPMITVFNKIDACQADRLQFLRLTHPEAHFVSALTGEGLETLVDESIGLARIGTDGAEFLFPHDRYDLVSRLRALGCLRSQEPRDEGVLVRAAPPRSSADLFKPFLLQ